jgi:TonB family protein
MSETLNKKIYFLFSFITHSVILIFFYFIGVHSNGGNGSEYIELGFESGSGGGGGTPFIQEEKINLDRSKTEDAIKQKEKVVETKTESDSKISQGNAQGDGSGTGTGGGSGDGESGGINLGLPSPPKPNEEIYLVAVDEMPEPMGGIQKIVSQLIIPAEAKAKRIVGTVFVLAYVDENGSVRKTLLTKGIGSGCDEAAMRAVSLSRFKPGKHHGRYVKVQVQIPIPIGSN